MSPRDMIAYMQNRRTVLRDTLQGHSLCGYMNLS